MIQRFLSYLRTFLLRMSSNDSLQVMSKASPNVTPSDTEFPKTLTTFPEDSNVRRPRLFEPAQAHHSRAYRQGGPLFSQDEVAQAWNRHQQLLSTSILQSFADNDIISKHLALRGSYLLREWFGSEAREPGDLDFTITPSDLSVDSEQGKQLLKCVLESLQQLAATSSFGLQWEHVLQDAIWSYDRSPGQRIVVPWSTSGIPMGAIQLDVVFGETVPEQQIELVEFGDSESKFSLLAASKSISLAWKLQWLLSDVHPQGKDLYDAVLLAESCHLDYELLYSRLCDVNPWWLDHPVTVRNVYELQVNWKDFQLEYPSITGTADDWIERLVKATRPYLKSVVGCESQSG